LTQFHRAHGATAQRKPILLLSELPGALFKLSVNTPALELLFQLAPRRKALA